MRTAIFDYISAIPRATLGTYTLSTELPWEQNGQPLYLNNLKTIYVDVDQTSQEPLYNVLNFADPLDEITTVRVYFVNDAKQLPSNYESLVAEIKDARNATGTEGYVDKVCQVSTEFSADRLITTFEFSFKKLLTN